MGGYFSSEQQTSPPPPEFKQPWRKFDWGQKAELKKRLENFTFSNPDVKQVKILLVGQIAAGKSNFINSINSALQGEIVNEALSNVTLQGCSFTKKLISYQISNECGELPFVISDIMGLEAGDWSGLQVEDIVKTILGHVKEDYTYKNNPIASEDEGYNKNPLVCDQAFCLVYIIAADLIRVIDQRLFEKMKMVREKISEKGLPQVVVMTKVDDACPLVKDDLKKIYTSKKIKQRMEMCSVNLGVPMSYIFPVKNYHEEIDTDDDIDVLLLKAFDQIVRSAKKRLDKGALK